jgi:spoIIIJ-associated protein
MRRERCEQFQALKEMLMSAYKEFQAKTVDQAIEEACRFFAVERDALEIEIVSGGSSGIFGLGAKKASIRAMRRRLAGVREEAPVPQAPKKQAPLRPAAEQMPVAEPVVSPVGVPAELAEEALPAGVDLAEEFDDEDEGVPAPQLSAEEMVRLEADIRSIMTALLRPIAEGVTLTVDVSANPVTVHIDDQESSGLIIGRDGQTITALQYLANRIVSKTWPQSPRIQLDAGDYRQKQEEQLLSIAQFLSEKAKKSGRVQSTRPLSSFHRRVVHMALQNDRGVQTRSKGEGHMKRVLILPVKRGKSAGRPPRRQEPPQARQS